MTCLIYVYLLKGKEQKENLITRKLSSFAQYPFLLLFSKCTYSFGALKSICSPNFGYTGPAIGW